MYEFYNSSTDRMHRLIPLEFTLGDPVMGDISEVLSNSCHQLYEYSLNLRQDFLVNPDRYYLNMCGGRNLYIKFTDELISYSYDNSHIYLSKEELENVFWKHHKGITSVLDRAGITLEKKLFPLKYMGFTVEHENDKYVFSNPAYPDMFVSLRLLCSTTSDAKLKNYGEYLRSWRDFRILVNPKHRQTALDIIRLLPEDMQTGAIEIYGAIKKLKLREIPYTPDFIRFVSKGKTVSVLKRDHFIIYFSCENAANDFIESCEPDMQQYMFKNFNYCRNCRSNCGNTKTYSLLDKNIKSCMGLNVLIENLENPKLIKMAKDILDMFNYPQFCHSERSEEP